MVAFVPLVAYLDVTACEIHSYNVGLLDAYCSPLHEMLCLPCLLCATCLALFVSLHLCMLAYMFMHESLCVFVSLSLVPMTSCGFTLVLNTRDLESLLGTLLDGTYVVRTPI